MKEILTVLKDKITESSQFLIQHATLFEKYFRMFRPIHAHFFEKKVLLKIILEKD